MPYLRKDIDMLEQIQRRATKLIPRLREYKFLRYCMVMKILILIFFFLTTRNKSVNCMSVSLTLVICKLLETIIRDNIMDLLSHQT